jgi:hypothetical protein
MFVAFNPELVRTPTLLHKVQSCGYGAQLVNA